jgi:hypothetical protein
MAAELAVEIATGQAEVARLTTETGKLHEQVNGKTFLALAVLSKFPSRLFDVVDVLSGQCSMRNLEMKWWWTAAWRRSSAR